MVYYCCTQYPTGRSRSRRSRIGGEEILRNKNQTGFTLIELLVVIAIIGLLASVVLLSLNSARAKSRDAKRLADMRQLSSALELYFNDFGGYPSTASAMVPTYIGLLPSAPTPSDGACGTAAYTFTPTGSSFTSPQSSGATVYPGYQYVFCLGGLTGGYSSGTHTMTQAGIQ